MGPVIQFEEVFHTSIRKSVSLKLLTANTFHLMGRFVINLYPYIYYVALTVTNVNIYLFIYLMELLSSSKCQYK